MSLNKYTNTEIISKRQAYTSYLCSIYQTLGMMLYMMYCDYVLCINLCKHPEI